MVWSPTIPGVQFLYGLNLVTTTLSLCGSIFITYYCLKSPSPRSVALKLLLGIGLSDFFYSISNLLSAFQDEETGPLCRFEAFLRQFSFILSIFWATCISILCYKTTMFGKRFNQEQFFRRMACVGFTISIIFTSIPLFVELVQYRNGNSFCYIDSVTDSWTFDLFVDIFYGAFPVGLGLIISLIGYVGAIRKLRKLPKIILEYMNINVLKLLWYPVILFLTFIPVVFMNLIENFDQSLFGVEFYTIYIILTHMIGLWNALAYGYQRNMHGFESETKTTKSDSMDSLLVEEEDSEIDINLYRAKLESIC